MKGKIHYFIVFIVIMIIILGTVIFLSFSRKTISAKEIFTEDVYKNLIEIDYWLGDTKIIINNKGDMENLYNNLTSLKLKEPGSKDIQKEGHIGINLVTNNESISIGLLSDEIIINGKKYDTDKNISDSFRNIALKYVDYYNNNIFTQNLFHDIIEIDCWVDNEKLVISDTERVEEVYHYLSRLTLEEASPEYKVTLEPMQIDMVYEDNTISFGILPTVLIANDKVYYTDSSWDLVKLITSIAKENH